MAQPGVGKLGMAWAYLTDNCDLEFNDPVLDRLGTRPPLHTVEDAKDGARVERFTGNTVRERFGYEPREAKRRQHERD